MPGPPYSWFPSTDNARLTDEPFGTFVDDKTHNSAFGRKPLDHNFNGNDLIMFATGDDDTTGRPKYYVVMKTNELDEAESNGQKFVEERSINGVISTGELVRMYQGRLPAGGTGVGGEDPGSHSGDLQQTHALAARPGQPPPRPSLHLGLHPSPDRWEFP